MWYFHTSDAIKWVLIRDHCQLLGVYFRFLFYLRSKELCSTLNVKQVFLMTVAQPVILIRLGNLVLSDGLYES